MDIARIQEYCLKKKGEITEEFPFGEDVLVFKLYGKAFVLMRLNVHPTTINLKCAPELTIELRERYASVQPGYHMNKKYWNTIILDGSIPAKEIYSMLDHSYDEVAKGLSKKARETLK